jgi:hypothetical protein
MAHGISEAGVVAQDQHRAGSWHVVLAFDLQVLNVLLQNPTCASL